DGLGQRVLGDRRDRVEVDDAGFRQALLGPQRDLGGYSPDARRDRRHDHELANGICLVTREKNDRAATRGRRQVGPPDFAPTPLPIASSCETPLVCSEYDLGHTKKPARDRAPAGRPATPGKFETAQGGWYAVAAVTTGVFVEPSVRLIPLGGLGEIGLNMMLIESGDDLIAIDCGLMFPDADEMPGIDYVIPDFAYALAKRDGFRAVFLTHGHEDHIGALPYLLREARVPVFGTPLTQALVAERLREHGLHEGADLRTMRPRDRHTIGPFTVEAIRVTHSIADGIGLGIETPVGTIVHTGDFKLDPSPLDGESPDYRRFAELGAEGVLVLCSDSTNVGRPG